MIDDAREEGITLGIQRNQIKMIQKMLDRNYTDEQIQEWGFTVQEIKLAKQMK